MLYCVALAEWLLRRGIGSGSLRYLNSPTAGSRCAGEPLLPRLRGIQAVDDPHTFVAGIFRGERRQTGVINSRRQAGGEFTRLAVSARPTPAGGAIKLPVVKLT